MAVTLWACASAAPAAGSESDSKPLFDKNCASCHGKDGRAKTLLAAFNKARDLTAVPWQESTSDTAIIESIRAGRGKMPAFEKQLSETQIEALLQYVRGLKKSS